MSEWQLFAVVNLTGGTTGSVQGQHSLDGHIHGGDVEGLKHDLGHLLPVGLGVQGGFCEQGGVLLGCHSQLVVEGVVPDLLHVVPVGDDTVLNGVLQSQDTPLALGLVADVGVLLTHTDHDTLKGRERARWWKGQSWTSDTPYRNIISSGQIKGFGDAW